MGPQRAENHIVQLRAEKKKDFFFSHKNEINFTYNTDYQDQNHS